MRVRFTLEFSREAADMVNELARKRGVSKSDVLRQAIGLLSYLAKQQDENSKILVMNTKGELRKIVPM